MYSKNLKKKVKKTAFLAFICVFVMQKYMVFWENSV